VDLGCGKGRVVLVAAQFPFQRVVGVDISPDLTEVARRNIQVFPRASTRCRDIEVQNADATRFEFPESNVLLHLYHPFDSEVTAAVLRRLEASVVARPRQVRIAYLLYTSAMPAVREVFSRFAWLRETRCELSLLGHYDWLFFSN
jgi:SAM-dependent methyltransferase